VNAQPKHTTSQHTEQLRQQNEHFNCNTFQLQYVYNSNCTEPALVIDIFGG